MADYTTTELAALEINLMNISHVKPLQIAFIIGFQYLFNSESLSDLISTCLYRKSEENKLNFQSEKMMSLTKPSKHWGGSL